MARRRDDDGAVEFPRRFPAPPSRVAPGRAGALRVGPGAGRLPEQLQTRFSVAPGLAPISASRFAVGPREESEATGLVGYRDVTVPLSRRQAPFDTPAKVFYPAAVEAFEVVDGRRVRRGGGPNADVATAFGGWPVLVLVHGQALSEALFGADEDVLCRGVQLAEDEPLWLYRRWGSTQRLLAELGYVSIAPDMSDRDGNSWRSSDEVVDVARWLLSHADSPWAAVVDPGRVGLVGHSMGTSDVVNARDALGAGAVAVLGPTPTSLDGPSLVIGASDDLNTGARGGSRVVFDENARPPKHLVLLEPHAHWAYFDGLCGIVADNAGARLLPAEAATQRTITRLALRRFFDMYLRGVSWPADLGLDDVSGVTAEGEV